jgi:cellulose synthase/poly-beta-1,6-N-acetylglucosamine synthase-like glycosyltransferase
MIVVMYVLLLTLIFLLTVPTIVFFVEIVAAVALRQPKHTALARTKDLKRIAVVVAAHNEGSGILATIADARAQLRNTDRLLVVADNCTDDTAAVAAAAGAEVIARHEPERRGKGYALAYGLDHLAHDPPEIVIVIDADCRLGDGAIDLLWAACTDTGRPVQALYLMLTPKNPGATSRFSEFTWRIRNWVRPLGLRALGLPCQLFGAGMAIPWGSLRSVDLANGSIVEDLMLGLDLASARAPALFCPSAIVTSEFPSTREGHRRQRLRWEGGHIGVILARGPHLMFRAITTANWDLLALALDVAVPPLSVLGSLLVGSFVIAGMAAFLGVSPVPMWVSLASLAGATCSILLCWFNYGRDVLPVRSIFPLAWGYLVQKIAVYHLLLFHKSNSAWTRTDRTKT